MKKIKLIFVLIMMLSLIFPSIFAMNPVTHETSSVTGEPNIPIHKSPRLSAIIGSMENGIYTLTFAKVYDNIEINVYHNDILVQQDVASFTVGQAYSIDLERYGEGNFDIEVYSSGEKIYCSSEVI
jgi:hypothetical protein